MMITTVLDSSPHFTTRPKVSGVGRPKVDKTLWRA